MCLEFLTLTSVVRSFDNFLILASLYDSLLHFILSLRLQPVNQFLDVSLLGQCTIICVRALALLSFFANGLS